MVLGVAGEDDLVRKTVREFAEAKIRPHAAAIDRNGSIPSDLFASLSELGLTSMLVPEADGGAGASTVAFCLAIEEVSRVSASLGVSLAAHNAAALVPVVESAADRSLVAALARPGVLAGLAVTEADAGSSLSNVASKLERAADGYVLDGRKTYVVNATYATHLVILAKLDGKLTAVVAELPARGVRVGPPWDLMGLRGTGTAPVRFESVDVPAGRLLGREGEGRGVIEAGINAGRLGVAACATGLAQGAFDASLAFARDRGQFGQKIIGFEAIRSRLVRMGEAIEAMRLLTIEAAARRDGGEPYAVEAARAKVFATEAAKEWTRQAIKVHGGTGFLKDFPVERMNRDARTLSVVGGPNEAVRGFIARRSLSA